MMHGMIEWYPPRPATLTAKLHWTIRVWMYHRLANAGRLQIGRLCVTWPMPWHHAVRNLPGYGLGRPSGVLAFFGRYDKPKEGK